MEDYNGYEWLIRRLKSRTFALLSMKISPDFGDAVERACGELERLGRENHELKQRIAELEGYQ